MFEIEKSLKSVGNFLHIQQNELFSSKSVGSMLPTVNTFGQKIIQLALLISYLRWTVFFALRNSVSRTNSKLSSIIIKSVLRRVLNSMYKVHR